MARLGWVLMGAGSSTAAAFAARFLWVAYFDHLAGDAQGDLTTAGFWAGLAVASVGAFTVAKANASRTPPV